MFETRTPPEKAFPDSRLRDYGARDSFDALDYLRHVRRHARFILVVSAAAAIVVLSVSLLVPKQYTATASIIIDPPAGNDPRTSIAVSPVYLESLRAYEMFVSSDTMFLHAIEKFHLRDRQNGPTLESAKRRILKVNKVRDTKVLEIAVTLPSPELAQQLAQYLAEQTVSLNRDGNLANDRDLFTDANKQMDSARAELDQEQATWREFSARQPYESLRGELETLRVSQERVLRDLLESRAELAEFSADPRAGAVQARVAALDKENSYLTTEIQSKAATLAARDVRAGEIQQRLRAAQANFDAAAGRLRDLQSAAGLRGERLRVMDPGVVPERPSFPNVGLNVGLALAVVLLSSLVYLALTFRPAES